MAFVVLTDVWVHRADDLLDGVRVDVLGGYAVQTDQPGEVRRYAGGRRRVVRRAGKGRTLTASFPATREVVARLEGWVGETVLVRDPGGRMVVGTYFSVDASEIDGAEWVDCAFTLEETTYSVDA